MNPNKTKALILLLSITGVSGFAIAANNKPTNNHAHGTAAVSVSDKTAKKISTAIGEEAEDFVVTKQEEAEAPAGFKGIEYTVETNGGKKYKCEILEPSKAGRMLSFGMNTGGDAMCTEFASTGKGQGRRNASQAAGRTPTAQPSGGAAVNTEAASPAAVSSKTAKKISTAIGEEVEDFVVTKQEEVEAPAGFKGIEYTVETNGGKKYKCEILEPSKAGRALSFGMNTGGDAMCTEFASTGKGQGRRNASQAAGRTPTTQPSGGAAANTEAASPAAVSSKTAKKISTAIGEEVEDFVVTKQEEVEAPAGFKGIEYTVETNGGKKYKCEILEPSKAGRALSFGMNTGGDAMCTDFTKGSKGKGKANQASCNALLRAAGKCT